MFNRANSAGIPAGLSRFRKEQDGSLMIFSLFIFVAMLLVAGTAIDFMRAETQRARIQATLDRAVLAGASLEQALDSKAVVRDYFDRAGLGKFLRDEDITVIEGEFSKTVSARASAPIQPFFMQMMGYQQLPAVASGTAHEGFSDIEVSLILDVSGSMGWSSSSGRTKMAELKDAAQEFVYRIQCNPDTENLFVDPCTVEQNTVSINLVMYNEQVLVGETLLQMFNPTMEHTRSSCVDFEHADYFDTAITHTQPLTRGGHFDGYSRWYKGYSGWELSYRARESNRQCRPSPANEIMPLEEDWVTLFNRIESLQALGGTSIEMGMKWGTALLDPSFRSVTTLLNVRETLNLGEPSVITEFSDRPANFTNNNVDKFVVLMTDGENTWHYQLKPEYRSGASDFWRGLDDDGDEVISVFRHNQQNYINPLNGSIDKNPMGNNPRQLDYVELWQRYNTDFFDNGRNNSGAHNWLPNPVNETNAAGKNADLVAICKAAKDENVQIYTIGFETSTASTAVMKKCASSHSHHFDVDGGTIDEAFAAIARNIMKLRLMN